MGARLSGWVVGEQGATWGGLAPLALVGPA